MEESIRNRYFTVTEKIGSACLKAVRQRDEVSLVVVTKGQPAEKIIEVMDAGATILGENYPEESLEKINQIEQQKKPIWHMIGHLQSRKIKLMYPNFQLIHSVDSLELAQKLDAFYFGKKEICNVLLEINLAGEESKFGFMTNTPAKRDQFLETVENLLVLQNLRLNGLMTMPPFAIREDQNKACYNLCHELLLSIKAKFGLPDFSQLSMGTSSDYETAIQCGATYIRVGEAIMGKRPIKKRPMMQG